MNIKLFMMSFCFMGLAGITADLHAAGASGQESVTLPYDVMDPSITTAKTYQKRGDYETAVLLYDAVLERNPSDQQALKSMVQCYKALQDENQSKPENIHRNQAPGDESLSDLPNLVPNDSTNAQESSQKQARPVL
jgi:hypothetical protein